MFKWMLFLLLGLSFQAQAQVLNSAQAKELETFTKGWFSPPKIPHLKDPKNFDQHITDKFEEEFLVALNEKLKTMNLPEYDLDSLDFDLNLTPIKTGTGVRVFVEIVDGMKRYCFPCYGDKQQYNWSVTPNTKRPNDLEGPLGLHIKCTMGLQSLQKNPVNPINRRDFSGSRFFPFVQTKEPTGFYLTTAKNILFFPTSLSAGTAASLPSFNTAAYRGTIENNEAVRIFSEKKADGTYSFREYTRFGLSEKDVGAGRPATDEAHIALLEQEIDKQFDQAEKESDQFQKEHEKLRRCQTLRACDQIKWSDKTKLKEKVGGQLNKYFCNTMVHREDNGRRIKTTPVSFTP